MIQASSSTLKMQIATKELSIKYLLSENKEIGPNSNKKTRKQKDNQSIGNEIPEPAKYAFIPVLKIPEYRVKESIIHENTSRKYRTQQKDEN